MTDIENGKKTLNESVVTECGDMPMAPQSPPASMNISFNAQGIDQIQELMGMLKNAGMGAAPEMPAAGMPMRQDMERLRAMVDEPEMEEVDDEIEFEDDGGFSSATTEPDVEYGDISDAIPNGNDLNKEKGTYKVVAGGDNPMQYKMEVESIKDRLYAQLSEKKAKPDFLDMDKDGDKKEPMKKAIADKKKKGPVKEEQVDEISNNTLAGLARLQMQRDAEKKYRDSKGIKPSMADLAGKFDQETIAGLTRLKMQHDAEKKYRDSKLKKKESSVSEISSDLAKRYTKAAKMDRDFNDDDLDRLPNKVRYGTDDEARQASADMTKLQRRNSKRTKGINRAAKRIAK